MQCLCMRIIAKLSEDWLIMCAILRNLLAARQIAAVIFCWLCHARFVGRACTLSCTPRYSCDTHMSRAALYTRVLSCVLLLQVSCSAVRCITISCMHYPTESFVPRSVSVLDSYRIKYPTSRYSMYSFQRWSNLPVFAVRSGIVQHISMPVLATWK